MGWGVYDYPSAPLEPAGAREIDGECQAKGCGAAFTGLLVTYARL